MLFSRQKLLIGIMACAIAAPAFAQRDPLFKTEILPVFWEDNYFSLLPGEERIISVSYDTANLQGAHPVIQVGGFNIEAGEVPAGAAAAH